MDFMAWKAKNLRLGVNSNRQPGNIPRPDHQANPTALYHQGVTRERQNAKFQLSFLSSLVEGMMDTVLVVNPKTGLVEYANKAALRMFDCQFEDLINHPADIFCHLETRLKFHEEIIRASLKESGWEGEVKSIRKSGEPFTSWLRSFSLKSEGELPWMLVMVQRDITQEKNLKEQFVQAGKLCAVEQKARETAHELNNLATILYGYIDFMLLKEGVPPELEKDLKTIQSIGHKATFIARQLMDLTRLQETNKTITELEPLIRETLQIVSKEFKRQGIQTQIINCQSTAVFLDPGRISQVLLNLCINAQHAMAEAPRKVLRIETGQEEGFAFLRISDTGCGISEENQARIFQPFFTTKGSDASGGRCSGNGLGLTVAKQIIEDHAGLIKVQSRVGEGTVFIIYLPLAGADTSQIKIPSHSPLRTAISHFQGKNILIVDDEYSIRQLVKGALELHGARVDAAGSGKEGLEMIRQRKYDLVLLDLQLQDRSGERLMDLINSIPDAVRPIKMVMSGKAGQMSQGFLNDFDLSPVLWKPFELEELYTKISDALRDQ